MKPIRHPPDAVLRAYRDLIHYVFLYLRTRPLGAGIHHEELFDLADAMHNVGDIITDYGVWTDDEKYREFYLRPFDEKWGNNSIRLEHYLETRLREHSKP